MSDRVDTEAMRLCPLSKRRATDEEWDTIEPGDGEHLCWCESGDLCEQGGRWSDAVDRLCDELDRTRIINEQHVADLAAQDRWLDRTREALREYGQHTTACAYSDWKWGVRPAHLKRGIIPPPEPECDCGLAVLAESGNTEPKVCPSECGAWRNDDGAVCCDLSDLQATVECPDPWHRTTDTEGEK